MPDVKQLDMESPAFLRARAEGVCRKGLHDLTPENIYLTTHETWTCRECMRIADVARSVRDRDKRNEMALRRWHALPDERKRAAALARRGLTVDDYDRLLARQGGVCAVCSTDEPGGKHGTHFAVDHDHDTGAVRGLLCSHCNLLLGNAKDTPATLRAAATYLERDR